MDRVIDGIPTGEGGEVFEDAFGVCPKRMWAVIVDQDAGFVIGIVGVACEVRALIDHHAVMPRVGQAVGRGNSRETGSDDQETHFFEGIATLPPLVDFPVFWEKTCGWLLRMVGFPSRRGSRNYEGAGGLSVQ